MKKNSGSATLEVTMLMPVILLIMVLFLTMLLGVLHQADMHSDLVVYSARQRLESSPETETEYIRQNKGDAVMYSNTSTMQFANEYALELQIEQTMRITDTDKNIRRWQLLGGIVSR
jgi:hypothetical protein